MQTSDAWDFRLVTAVEPDAANDRTRVAWARGLGASDPFSNPPAQPGVFALRKRAAVFGNNAPVWRSMDPRFRAGYAAKFGGSSTADEWRNFTITPASPSATAGAVDLDQVQSEIAADVPGDITRRSFAVLAKGGFNRRDENFPSGTYVELYRVTAPPRCRAPSSRCRPRSRAWTWPARTSTSSSQSPRETSVYARSELMPLAPTAGHHGGGGRPHSRRASRPTAWWPAAG